MKVKLSSTKVDLEKEVEGTWVDAPEFPGVRFRVRSLEYPAYKTTASFEVQRLLRKYGRADTPSEEFAKLRGKLLAEHILLEWSGFDEPYTAENALQTLCNPGYRKICDAVESAARYAGEPQIEFIEDAVKN